MCLCVCVTCLSRQPLFCVLRNGLCSLVNLWPASIVQGGSLFFCENAFNIFLSCVFKFLEQSFKFGFVLEQTNIIRLSRDGVFGYLNTWSLFCEISGVTDLSQPYKLAMKICFVLQNILEFRIVHVNRLSTRNVFALRIR